MGFAYTVSDAPEAVFGYAPDTGRWSAGAALLVGGGYE